jgi:hypothetical protein
MILINNWVRHELLALWIANKQHTIVNFQSRLHGQYAHSMRTDIY